MCRQMVAKYCVDLKHHVHHEHEVKVSRCPRRNMHMMGRCREVLKTSRASMMRACPHGLYVNVTVCIEDVRNAPSSSISLDQRTHARLHHQHTREGRKRGRAASGSSSFPSSTHAKASGRSTDGWRRRETTTTTVAAHHERTHAHPRALLLLLLLAPSLGGATCTLTWCT